MRKAKGHRGSTLALVVVCIGVIAVLVAFFALNYGQFLGTHKRAKRPSMLPPCRLPETWSCGYLQQAIRKGGSV